MAAIINQLTPELFWDTPIAGIDEKKHAKFIVERVIMRGSLTDFLLLKSYYGMAKLRQIVKKIRYMDKQVLNFCSLYFNIKLNLFRCYSTIPLTHTHWNY